ncbi:hypothetical protein CHS0354_008696 [Potamilus streckersoni]|uniref:Uncharacterized protein n=1 Tax=Potamilus streckersoni TaxID=2493646 RepID=A0AAE0THP2_9BIVA|nr:hypothetical protein CHS0354_008696 [Potamilus streckersoni]
MTETLPLILISIKLSTSIPEDYSSIDFEIFYAASDDSIEQEQYQAESVLSHLLYHSLPFVVPDIAPEIPNNPSVHNIVGPTPQAERPDKKIKKPAAMAFTTRTRSDGHKRV